MSDYMQLGAVLLLLYPTTDGTGTHDAGKAIAVQVWTSNDTKADTRSGIYIQVIMEYGASNYSDLTHHARGYQRFEVMVEKLGPVIGFVLGVFDSVFNDGWKLDSATITSIEEKQSISCFIGNWTGPYLYPPEFRWPLGCVQWEPWPNGVHKWHFVRWSRAVRYNDDRTRRGKDGGRLRNHDGFIFDEDNLVGKRMSGLDRHGTGGRPDGTEQH